MDLDPKMTLRKYHKHKVRQIKVDLFHFNYKVIQKLFKPFYKDLKNQIGKFVGIRDLNQELQNY